MPCNFFVTAIRYFNDGSMFLWMTDRQTSREK